MRQSNRRTRPPDPMNDETPQLPIVHDLARQRFEAARRGRRRPRRLPARRRHAAHDAHGSAAGVRRPRRRRGARGGGARLRGRRTGSRSCRCARTCARTCAGIRRRCRCSHRARASDAGAARPDRAAFRRRIADTSHRSAPPRGARARAWQAPPRYDDLTRAITDAYPRAAEPPAGHRAVRARQSGRDGAVDGGADRARGGRPAVRGHPLRQRARVLAASPS